MEEPLSPLIPTLLIVAAALVALVRQYRDHAPPDKPRDKPW